MPEKIKNLIFDCDGVLYPISMLTTKEIIDAMKKVYREDLGVSGNEQNEISQAPVADNHRGLFNYILEICRYKNFSFDRFCKKMADNIDYGRIIPNPLLWRNLQNLASNYNVAVLSNNSRPHVAKVMKQLFGKSLSEIEQGNIKIFDISSSLHNGHFHPKQSDDGLSIFCKRANIIPCESMLFDDVPLNIESAQKIGMHGTIISDKNPLSKALKPFLKNIAIREKNYE